MKHLFLTAFFAAAAISSGATKTYTGVITDTMCGKSHAAMGVQPDGKCVRDCVKSGNGKWKYALLFEKTGILKAEKIEAAR
jgi:hypothetical protein